MKVVILAGGFGTRLSEETHSIPKPMVEIGGKPILWHIMKIYSHYGYNDFIICLGYKGHIIKEYFANYFLHHSDVTFNMADNSMKIHNNHSEPWKVTLVETGLKTMTGGRIKKLQNYLSNETFMLTYGDGVGNVNIEQLVKHHKENGDIATITAVIPEGRFGALNIDFNKVTNFAEKRDNNNHWMNGGFFVLEPEVLDYIDGDDTIWEREPLEKLAKENKLTAFFHKEFWKPMDTLADKSKLEEMWQTNNAPWKLWNN